jgi:putative hemolysin
MKRFMAWAAVSLLTACATPHKGPYPLEGERIAIAGKAPAPRDRIDIAAYQEATQFCARQGKQLLVMTDPPVGQPFALDAAPGVEFSCIGENDFD